MRNFISVAQTLLEISSGNGNPRWQSGGHIGYLIGSKIELDLCLICTNKYANFKSIAQTLLEILSRDENPRWPPGGHIRFLIGSKIELDLHLICTNKCAKFQINCSKAS